MSSDIEDIKSKLNVVDVVQDYLPLKKAGVNFKARCPFHDEKTPSFHVNPARQIWHCFGCGLGGDIFEFIKNIEAVEFPQALERMAEKAGVTLERRAFQPSESSDKKKILYELNDLAARYYNKTLLESKSAEEAREYLKKRKFSFATINAWQIGYALDDWATLYQFLKKKGYNEEDVIAAGLIVKKDEGGSALADRDRYFDRFRDRITFPIVDVSGRIAGFSARILHPRENVGKYINSADSPVYNKSRILFGLYQARNDIRKKNTAVIVEGNVDVVKSAQAGVTNVAASSGTALTDKQLEILKRFCENLIFAFDTDDAGSEAQRRALEAALAKGFNVRIVQLPENIKDPDEAIEKDPKIWTDAVEKAAPFLDFYFADFFDIIDLNDAVSKKDAVAGFLALLSNVPDPIVTAHYIKKVSDKILVKEQVITDLLRKHSVKKDRGEKGKAKIYQTADMSRRGLVKADPAQILEQRFVGLLLNNPALIGKIISGHSAQQFLHNEYSEIIIALKQANQSGFSEVVRQFSRAKPAIEVAKFAASSEFADEDPIDELQALSQRIKKNYFNREKNRIALAIASAEREGRVEDKIKYAQEYNNIIQKFGDYQ